MKHGTKEVCFLGIWVVLFRRFDEIAGGGITGRWTMFVDVDWVDWLPLLAVDFVLVAFLTFADSGSLRTRSPSGH